MARIYKSNPRNQRSIHVVRWGNGLNYVGYAITVHGVVAIDIILYDVNPLMRLRFCYNGVHYLGSFEQIDKLGLASMGQRLLHFVEDWVKSIVEDDKVDA